MSFCHKLLAVGLLGMYICTSLAYSPLPVLLMRSKGKGEVRKSLIIKGIVAYFSTPKKTQRYAYYR